MVREEVKSKNVLKPFGELDVLYYYSRVAPLLVRFLKNKEIATKIYLKNINLLKRATKQEPLFVDEIKTSLAFLKLRAKGHLDEVRDKINKQQEKLWDYFFPRKLIELHYAVNSENTLADLDRVYFDIDAKGVSAELAVGVVKELINTIKKDKDLNKQIKIKKFFILWTGNSFHVYLLLQNKISHSQYMNLFQIKKDKKITFVEKWAQGIDKKFSFKVLAKHEKQKGIIIDPSQSPPGKLGRCPFSLHVKSYKEYNGIAVPVSEAELSNKNLIDELKTLSPEKVLKNLNKYIRLL